MIEEDRNDQIDLQDYLRVIMKRGWTIFTFFTVVVLTVAFQTFSATPIYQAVSRIVIERENPNVVSIQEVMVVNADESDYYQTQYKIIESRTVAREVINRLKLRESHEFFPPPKDNIFSNIKSWFTDAGGFWGDWITSTLKTETGSEKYDVGNDKSEESEEPEESESDSRLINAFLGRASVQPIRNSRLVDVSVAASDPKLAARMANELVRSYIAQNLEIKLKAAKDAVKWLADRADEERSKVEVAEKALLDYKREQGVVTDFSIDADRINAQNLANLSTQVVNAESMRVVAETRYEQAVTLEANPEMLDSIPEVLKNPLIREIKKMEVEIYNKMSELSKKYGQKHPRMVAIRSELADLDKRKKREIRQIVNSLRNEYRLAIAKENSLRNALDAQNAQSLVMKRKGIQFGVLSRQVDSSRYMYEMLIKRFKETALTGEIKTGNIRVIDKAEIPLHPIKPNKRLNIILAVIVGLTLGVGLAFFLEYLDNTIKLPEEVKSYLKIPYLGPIPAFATKKDYDGVPPDLVTVHSPKSGTSESFNGLRTSILLSSVDSAPQVVLVSSSGPDEGKTICSANLAVTMAHSSMTASSDADGLEEENSRVLLLDCDMRRPRLHQLFEVRRGAGISNILVGKGELQHSIVHTPIPNLDIIPCGPIPPNPSEILGSRKMRDLIAELRKVYTRIVIDSPPVMAVTDTMVLAPLADGIVYVVRAGDTPRQVAQNGLRQLTSINANILGAVLNCVGNGKDGYYDYQYYYYYGDDEEGG